MKRMVVLLLSGVAFGTVGASAAAEPLRVVSHVDLGRYVGTWYEIASIPASFQRFCAGGTTATYTLLPNGQVQVTNQCYTSAGEPRKAVGRAWVADQTTNARLKVSFVSIFGIWLFSGDYWIIDLGERYEYAVVGHPSRNYGWILSRTPTLPQEVLAGIYRRLAAQGYDVSRFRMTDQTRFLEKPEGGRR